jgi:uncharacterized protein
MTNTTKTITSLRCPETAPVEPWGETLSGDRYYYLNPDPAIIEVHDIARSLSYTCRYNGHLRRFYSVAEHSIHMAISAQSNPLLAFLALCHDAHEPYCGDVASPQKAAMILLDQGEGAHSIIERLAKNAVEQALGLDKLWTPDLRRQVKMLDTRICIDERQVLKPATDNDWGLGDLEPLGVDQQIANFGWENLAAVEAMWLNMYCRLGAEVRS